MLRNLILACVSLGTLVTVSTSAMATPFECRNNSTYHQAYKERYSELKWQWQKNYRSDCDKQLDFENVFYTILGESGPASRKCRNAGRNAATDKVINEISKKCSFLGKKYGAEDGRDFGREYCALSGWHGAAVITDFEFSYQESCSNVFTRYANRFCPSKKAQDPYFAQTVKDNCTL